MPEASILIVEDEVITSLDIQEELENLGYQVTGTAINGEEALEMAKVRPPDLILMDINLRGKLDGIQTTLKLKEKTSSPVIFVTAMVDGETIQRAKHCEPYGYIIKPIRQDDLRTAIEHALYKHEAEQTILRQAEFAQKLVGLTALLNSHLDLHSLLESICNEIAKALDLDAALITLVGYDNLVDPEKDKAAVAHHYGPIPFDEYQALSLELHRHSAANDQSHFYIYDIQEELAQNPDFPFIKKNDIRSVMLVELNCDSRLIGTFNGATISRTRRFSEDELNFLLTFANQAAIAIDRALLYQEARNRADELKILGGLSSKLRLVENPQEMLPILLNGAMDLVQAEAGLIYLLGPAGNPIHQFESLHKPVQLDAWFSPDSQLWARALSNEAVLHIPETWSPSREMNDTYQSQPLFHSSILLSLRSVDTLSAVMALGIASPVKIDAHVQQVLSSLAEMGGNALHRSGLMGMLEKRVSDRSTELNTLYDLSIYINSPINFEEKLDGALQKVMASIGADSGVIYSYEADNNRLHLLTEENMPLNLFPDLHESSVTMELRDWLETSTIPWLANQGEHQASPLKMMGAAVFDTNISLPIRFEGKALGLLCILWKTQPDLSPENIALLIALTERIGSAVQNEIMRQKSENAALLEERNRLGRELHDSVTQSLYSQALLAEAAGDMLAENQLSRLNSCLVDLKENSLQALKEMRLLLFELRPSLIGEQDLAKALQYRLEAVEHRAGITTFLDTAGNIVLPAKVEDELYHVALEALNNSLKHSGAKSVRVTIHAAGPEFQLIISDSGKGFNLDENLSGGMGLTSMRDRVRQLGGDLEIASSPGEGTKVAVRLNLEQG